MPELNEESGGQKCQPVFMLAPPGINRKEANTAPRQTVYLHLERHSQDLVQSRQAKPSHFLPWIEQFIVHDRPVFSLPGSANILGTVLVGFKQSVVTITWTYV